MSEQSMINALRKLRESTFKNKTARLRDLYDEVEALRSNGFSHAKIVETMWDQGLKFDLKTFEVTFYRIKKERDIGKTKTRASEPLQHVVTIANKSEMVTSTRQIPKALVNTVSQDELRNIARGKFDPNQFLDE